MKTQFKILLTFALLWCAYSPIHAGVLTFHQRIEPGLTIACPTILGGSSCAATTVQVLPALGDFSDRNTRDIITLGIDHSYMQWYPDSFDCRVGVTIQEWDRNGNPMPLLTDSLRVRYTPFTYTTYLDKNAFLFKDAYKYTVTITGVKITGTAASFPANYLPLNVYLDADIDLQRYNDFVPYASTPISPSAVDSDFDCDGIKDEVYITWPTVVGAEQYDLEWTFVNDYDVAFNTYLPSSSLDYNFRFNSTRITTTNTNYGISLIYEHGYIVYRVRGVGKDTTNPSTYLTGVWSIADSGNVSSVSPYQVTSPHQLDSMDYQYNATFAEEGKKKEVVTYYDGSLRSREAVTKMNSDHNVLVGQTIYDYQGRPAVTVLPVPVKFPSCSGDKQPSIHYYSDFNLHDSLVGATPYTRPYSRLDFDRDAGDSCSIGADTMSVFGGASNYYSPQNPNQKGFQSYVPDAHGFPFSQVQYTPDNTGRIRTQGGVGQQFQIGSGHETKYIYGQPFQLELDMMFGSEAGDASHYKKNIVIDPNGQASVSYLDQEGRTIATCLAGNPGTDSTGQYTLAPLASQGGAAQYQTVDLFAANANGYSNENQVNLAGNSIVFNTQIAVGYTSTYAFKYFVSVDTLKFPCSSICFNCAYILKIRVTNDCGQVVAPISGNNQDSELIGNFSVVRDTVIFSTACHTPSIDSSTQEFKINLTPGNYTVSKILTVDTAALHFYEQQYIDTSTGCVKSLYDFQHQYLANVDTCSCHITCATCIASLGTRDNFIAAGKGTGEQYDFLYEQCQAPCKSKSLCDVQYQQMLADMSPGGQYGQYLNASGNVYPFSFPLSIFNDTNSLSANVYYGTGNWRFPKVILNGHTYNYYVNSDGTQSFINLDSTLTGFIPQVVNIHSPAVMRDPITLKYYTTPNNLKNFSDFIGYWQSSWAQCLVTYHPEYCYYEICQSYENIQTGDTLSSETFDEKMQGAQTFADAVSAGFINVAKLPTTDTTGRVYDFSVTGAGHIYDPFLTNSYFQSLSGFNIDLTFNGVIRRYKNESPTTELSMVEAAAQAARCGTNYGSSFAVSCQDFGNDYFAPSFTALNDSIKNKEWNYFKNFYFSEKQQLQKQIQDHYTLYTCSAYNNCIGNSNLFNPYADGMFAGSPKPFFELTQPCGYKTYGFYANKQKRFVDQNDIPNQSQSDADYQYYLLTGQCPLAAGVQFLMAALAQSGTLASSGIILTGYPQFTQAMYAAITPTPPVVGIVYRWDATPAGDILTANLTDNSTNIVHCTVTLNKTGMGIASWGLISSLQDLQYTGTIGGMDQFTVTAVINNPSDPTHPKIYKTITGSCCINIHGCQFQQECKPNQFALDIQSLMSALADTALLLHTNVNLETAGTIKYFLTPTILNTLGIPHSNMRWSYISPNEFDLFDNVRPSVKIKFTITNYTPGSFTPSNLSSLTGFDSINSNYQNHFVINGDAGLHRAVLLNMDASYDSIGNTRGISMGNCGLPTPINCEGPGYKNLPQLEALLNDVLTKKPFKADIDLTKSAYFTQQLSSYFPNILDSTASNDDSTNVGIKYKETLTFKLYVSDTAGGRAHKDSANACPFYIAHTDSTHPHLKFANLVQIEDFKAIGNQVNGNLVNFSFVGVYTSTDGVLHMDSVFGTSCIPLLNCNACASNEPPPVTGPAGGPLGDLGAGQPVDSVSVFRRDSALLARNVVAIDTALTLYRQYKLAVAAVNTSNSWTPTDSNYITPEAYTNYAAMGNVNTMRAHLHYIKYFDTALDNLHYLKSLKSFAINYGNRINAKQAYTRYTNAIAKYNTRAISVSGAITLTPLSDSLFHALGMTDSINLYIAYLKPYPWTGHNPVSDTAFLRSLGTLAPADSCTTAYIRYLNAYLKFERRQLDSNTIPDYEQVSPLYTYKDFVTNGLCSSKDTGYAKINNYIAIIQDTTKVPGVLPNVPMKALSLTQSLSPFVSAKDCERLYGMYIQDVLAFDHSIYSSTHSGYQLNAQLYPSFQQFEQAGLCNCAAQYIQYLMPYITASDSSLLPLPVSINNYGPCGDVVIPKDTTCDSAYSRYIRAVEQYNAFVDMHGDSLPSITQIYPDSDFTSSGFCYCVSAYIGYLNSVEKGTVTAPPFQMIQNIGPVTMPITMTSTLGLGQSSIVTAASIIQSYLDIGTDCQAQETPPCTGTPTVDTSVTLKYTPKGGNPCVQQLLNNALHNAQNAYNDYIDSILTAFRITYMNHCLKPFESYILSDTDKQYHYTLYYYDQAGNLIRTSPPQGTQLVGAGLPSFSYTNPLEQQIISDRTYNQHTFFTNDVLTSTYVYNSLNQLTKQTVPDDDNMNNWQFTLPNGLDNRLVTTGVQFVDASKGYLSGYVPAASGFPRRGYLYNTHDGGHTWQRLNGLVAANINKVEMHSNTNGYAVGEEGILLSTINSGQSWDIVPLYLTTSTSYTTSLNDVAFDGSATNMVVGASGRAFTINSGTIADASSGIASTDSLTGVTYDGSTHVFMACGDSAGYGVIYESAVSPYLSWTKRSAVTTQPMYSVQFLGSNPSEGFAGGNDGVLMHSKDKGKHWFARPTTIRNRDFRKIYFVTSNVGVALIDSSNDSYKQIFLTSNGGLTWKLLSKPGAYYNDMNFYYDPSSSTYKGIACGLKGVITRILSTPSNVSPYFALANLNPPSSFVLNSAYALPTGASTISIIVGGESHYVYYVNNYNTSNATVTWDSAGFPARYKKVSMLLNNHKNMLPALITDNRSLYRLKNNNANPPIFIGVDSATDHFTDLVATGPDSIFTFNYSTKKLEVLDSNLSSPSTELAAPVVLTNALALSTNHLSAFGFAGNQNFGGTDSAAGALYTASVSGSAVTWGDVSSNTHPLKLYDIREDNAPPHFFAVGDYGTALYGNTAAGPFLTLADTTTQRLYSISARNITTGLIAGDSGALYSYTYSGINLNITRIVLPITTALFDIASQFGSTTAYIAGAKGTELYITNAFSVSPTIQIGIGGGPNDLRGIAQVPSSTSAVAVGTNTTAFIYGAATGTQIFDLFTPGLNGSHFINSNAGYAVGDDGTIRRTDNGGTSWQLVLPEINNSGTPNLNTVWTTSTGNAILGGTGNFFGQTYPDNLSASATGYAFGSASNTWFKVRFNSNILDNGWMVGATGSVLNLNVTAGALSTFSTLSGGPSADLHSLHVFRDNSFMAVGTGGAIYYYNLNSTPVWNNESPTGLSGYTNYTFNDIDARDDRTGWIVGDSLDGSGNPVAGEILKVIIPVNIQSATPSQVVWNSEPVGDGLSAKSIVTNPNQILFNAIAASGPYDLFVGGSYSGTPPSNTQSYPYARLLNDQGGQFSKLFWYDRVGNQIINQITKQSNYKKTAYTYILYDDQERIIETGQKTENTDTSNNFNKIFGDTIMNFYNPNAISPSKFLSWIKDVTGPRTEVTHTFYDIQDILPARVLVQKETRNRAASITYSDTLRSDSTKYNNATHYSYDLGGNVDVLIQDDSIPIAGQRYKTVSYNYDLVSGRINEIDYQSGQLDQYHHKYNYDADKRITSVSTSKDSIMWDNDANYFYYAHGPLARLEIGDQQIQGMDYAYTLRGWIKGVNSDLLDSNRDMGHDGLQIANNLNRYFARDVMGYTLKYFKGEVSTGLYGDYDAINKNVWNNNVSRFEARYYNSDLMKSRHDLFDGDISAMVTNLQQPTEYTGSSIKPISLPQGTAYNYDQLHRLIEMKAYQNLDTDNIWGLGTTYAGLYHNWFTYDANGNILTQKKADQLGNVFDSLSYHYNTQSGVTLQNRLYHVNDAIPGTVDGITDDIRDEGVFNSAQSTINQKNNYRYTSMGELAKDTIGGIDTIIWNNYGKIWKIRKYNGDSIIFGYNGHGDRIMKTIKPSGGSPVITYYIDDQQGEELAIYNQQIISSTMTYTLIERNIYGKDRLGSDVTPINLISPVPMSAIDTFSRYVGLKHYELLNHTDNVLALVSDRKIPRPNSSATQINHYEADVLSSNDYYPYGSYEPGRSFNASFDRYGFNGKEKDDEISGSGNTYYFTARIYDSRLGKWMTTDPMAIRFANASPYRYGQNNPIFYIDLGGLTDYTFHVRSFIPEATVLNFGGDDRNFSTSTDLHITSRVNQQFTLNTDEGKLMGTHTWSDPSHMAIPNPAGVGSPPIILEKTAEPERDYSDVKQNNYEALNQKNFSFNTSYSASDPFLPIVAPTIDFKNYFFVQEDKANGLLHVDLKIVGDKYPAIESFISDPKGNTVFLGVAGKEGSIMSDYGTGTKTLINSKIDIIIDKEGNFTGVKQGDKTYSLKDWNAQFTKADAKKNESKPAADKTDTKK